MGEWGGGEGEGEGEQLIGGAEGTHISLKFKLLYGSDLWCPKIIIIVHQKSLIKDHHNKYNNETT